MGTWTNWVLWIAVVVGLITTYLFYRNRGLNFNLITLNYALWLAYFFGTEQPIVAIMCLPLAAVLLDSINVVNTLFKKDKNEPIIYIKPE